MKQLVPIQDTGMFGGLLTSFYKQMTCSKGILMWISELEGSSATFAFNLRDRKSILAMTLKREVANS